MEILTVFVQGIFFRLKYLHIPMWWDSKSTKTLLYKGTDSLKDTALQMEDASQNAKY